jgi:hypothetical protein
MAAKPKGAGRFGEDADEIVGEALAVAVEEVVRFIFHFASKVFHVERRPDRTLVKTASSTCTYT